MREIPLTPEQKTFAEKHHGLVYKFLNKNQLSADEFYDVVIFGYLRAVRRFLQRQLFKIQLLDNRLELYACRFI